MCLPARALSACCCVSVHVYSLGITVSLSHSVPPSFHASLFFRTCSLPLSLSFLLDFLPFDYSLTLYLSRPCPLALIRMHITESNKEVIDGNERQKVLQDTATVLKNELDRLKRYHLFPLKIHMEIHMTISIWIWIRVIATVSNTVAKVFVRPAFYSGCSLGRLTGGG